MMRTRILLLFLFLFLIPGLAPYAIGEVIESPNAAGPSSRTTRATTYSPCLQHPGVGTGVGAMGSHEHGRQSYRSLRRAADRRHPGRAGRRHGYPSNPRTLILDLNAINFNKASVTNYEKRGMQTDKHDYSYLQFGNYGFSGARLTATFAERKFEVYGGGYKIQGELKQDPRSQREHNRGHPEPAHVAERGLGARDPGDMTDDYSDPRRGLRLETSRWWSPPVNSNSPDFYRMEYSATGYIPLGKRSTWRSIISGPTLSWSGKAR